MSDNALTAAEENEARAIIYRFFSNVFLYPPDEELIRKLPELLQIDEMAVLFESATLELVHNFVAELEQQDIQALRQEYFDLFVVPTSRYVCPFEDVYIGCASGSQAGKGPLLGTRAISVTRKYRQAGAAMDERCKELPTHAGVEFSFLSFLCEKEAEAARPPGQSAMAGDLSQTSFCVNAYRELQQRFLCQHLGAWLPQLVRTIQANARTPYFANLALMSGQYVEQELTRMPASINTIQATGPERSAEITLSAGLDGNAWT